MRILRVLFPAAIAGVVLLGTAGCGVSKEVAASQAAGKSGQRQAAPTQAALFSVPQNQLAQLTIVPVKRANWSVSIDATGTVDWDADLTTVAISQVSGPIARIVVDMGGTVAAGDPLLYVSSPDLVNAVATYKIAENRLDLAKRTLDRSRDLLAHKAIAQKDMESAEADYNDAYTQVQNAMETLKIFGIDQNEITAADQQGVSISPLLPVRAPITGTIVQKLVSPGQLVQAGATTCFSISDVHTVWVQGHVYDKDLTSVQVGDRVDESNPSIPDKFEGVISYIGAMMDAATRTTPVRIATQNPNGLLKKDMYVNAVIHTRTRRNILTVPTSAILQNEQNEPFVYVEESPGQFATRLVSIGAQQDGATEIVSGCKEGEKVVAEGSVFLQFANSLQ